MDSVVQESTIDAVRLAQALIRCRSVTPDDGGAVATLAQALESLGFECHRLVFGEAGTPDIVNLYARLGTAGRHFCFAGHSDVVPVGDPALWRADPFAGTVEGGVLVGRGAADMKGAVAAFTAACARFVAGRGPDFGGSISLLITGDEEGPAINGTRKVLDWLDARGETIDACLVGEPTSTVRVGDTIKVGRRGSLNAVLTVEGVAGHAAYPHLADNPIHRLVAMLADLTATPLDAPTEHFEASTFQVTTIDVGNTATNVTPAKARAAFNTRFNDRWSGASLDAHLRDRLARHGGRWTFDTLVSSESFLTPPGDLADLVADATESVTGVRPAYSTTGGVSDARFIRRVAPVAELGLVGATMHKLDEAVPVADIETLTQIYQAVLDRFFR